MQRGIYADHNQILGGLATSCNVSFRNQNWVASPPPELHSAAGRGVFDFVKFRYTLIF